MTFYEELRALKESITNERSKLALEPLYADGELLIRNEVVKTLIALENQLKYYIDDFDVIYYSHIKKEDK